MPTLTVGTGPTWTPRTRYRKDGKPYRRNIWHETLMEAYSDALWIWEQGREEFSYGHATEAAEYARLYQRPLLKDFMVRLSRDWRYSKDLAAAAA